MITKIEVLNYRGLKHVSQELKPFQVLIGPNASGKSTLMDAFIFLNEIVTARTINDAIKRRSDNFRDLVWRGKSDYFEIALEAKIPDTIQSEFYQLRYQIRVGVVPKSNTVGIMGEELWLFDRKEKPRLNFVAIEDLPEGISSMLGSVDGDFGDTETIFVFPDSFDLEWDRVIKKTQHGDIYYDLETFHEENPHPIGFRQQQEQSAFLTLPAIPDQLSVTNWFLKLMAEQITQVVLDTKLIREASFQAKDSFLEDGSNLVWHIYKLETNHPDDHKEWVEHVETGIRGVKDIRTDTKGNGSRYFVIEYEDGAVLPSWVLSDGTLQLLAMTILAYLPGENAPGLEGVILIEEPENGLHPQGIDTLLDSLRSLYDAQILVATHSTVFLNAIEPEQLLLFSQGKGEDGAVTVIAGDKHPRLVNWKHEVSLSTLFASWVFDRG